MNYRSKKLQSIPTNIISGFLGVGKTSAIMSLLKAKPGEQRWAVLVNEFGEIGIDGNLLQGRLSEDSGVFIREVPGGCMCCTAGLPMQVALNHLLMRAKPQRLLIEPTGLGHPKEVLQLLSGEHYRDVLTIQKNVTLVDARKLNDPRYTKHDTFNQQIDMADTIVGNKNDLYQRGDKENLRDYLKQRGKTDVELIYTSYGQLDATILEGTSIVAKTLELIHHHYQGSRDNFDLNESPIPDCGYLRVENQGEGYRSVGWRFAPDKVFDQERLFVYLSGLDVERLKGVFITNRGIFGYNRTPDVLKMTELDDCLESRFEIIYQNTQVPDIVNPMVWLVNEGTSG